MVDVTRVRIAIVLDINRCAVGHVLLGNVEHVAVRIVCRDAGERVRRRALETFQRGILLRDTREGFLGILDLDAEMVEASRTSRATWIYVEANIAVADGRRAGSPVLGDVRMPMTAS